MATARFDWVGPGLVVGGRYRVESLLGEGGYGAVFVATQLNLDRRVALKLLHPEVLQRPHARERFEREARVTQQLTHPNIVRLFDFGTTEHGLPFIICELLEGRSLEDELRRVGPFPDARIAHIAQQTLKGLAEAHARGIIHRDIKPANIYLCDYTGEADFVKILDFGIAAAPLEAGSKGLTQEGVSLGTPAYMSPEQVLDQPLDGRADLYSLGLVMAEMLTGSPVYEGTTAMAVALRQIAAEPAPLAPQVRASALAPVIARATQKDIHVRFANALDMLQTLQHTVTSGRYSIPIVPSVHPEAPPAPTGPTFLAMPGSVGSLPLPSTASGPYASMPSASRPASIAPPSHPPVGPSARPLSQSVPYGSSIGWQLQASGAAQARPPRSKTPFWIAGGVLACTAVGIGSYALATARATSNAPSESPSAKVVATVVKTEEASDKDPFDEALEKALPQLLTQIMAQGMGGGCGQLSPEENALMFAGSTLAQLRERASRNGFQCITHSFIKGSGSMMFFGAAQKGAKGFQLNYFSGEASQTEVPIPNAAVLRDPNAGTVLYVIADSTPESERLKAMLMAP